MVWKRKGRIGKSRIYTRLYILLIFIVIPNIIFVVNAKVHLVISIFWFGGQMQRKNTVIHAREMFKKSTNVKKN